MEEQGKNIEIQKDNQEEDIIAYRKSCDAEGTGLSHYILMDKEAE